MPSSTKWWRAPISCAPASFAPRRGRAAGIKPPGCFASLRYPTRKLCTLSLRRSLAAANKGHRRIT
jgi:hypothetical protein